ncbi:MAG: aspartyl/glutamyl-tRNA amidotransferase subunit C [Ignisphaera sp.]|nr:aspartyl/glutamyl-tRNA amidotransferase subunit C [Ignisphaera sp.]MCX8167961.1 aspartyl/glutamyl-tRNA amidotransferase subunit C [Ignisphaera sp.]MDW8085558.1 Asp-tRNA(Asn)/Glu-tRNA(Gln) amidotransferase subunit GatC [Ignisphaera sp.]
MPGDVVEYLERLILIRFSDDERERIKVEIDKIINLFNELKNVEGIDRYEPLFHVHEVPSPLRVDETFDKVDEEHSMLRDNALLVNGYVKAPKTTVE